MDDVPVIRLAKPSDLDDLYAVDDLARSKPLRRERIARGIADSEIWVVTLHERVVGYALVSYRFFGHGFIELVMIHPNHRGVGLGPRLIEHVESICSDRKLFTTTNESNARMRRVLERLGYEKSGIIHNLDPGDPELVYFKQLSDS